MGVNEILWTNAGFTNIDIIKILAEIGNNCQYYKTPCRNRTIIVSIIRLLVEIGQQLSILSVCRIRITINIVRVLIKIGQQL